MFFPMQTKIIYGNMLVLKMCFFLIIYIFALYAFVDIYFLPIVHIMIINKYNNKNITIRRVNYF